MTVDPTAPTPGEQKMANERAIVAKAQCENCGEWLDQLSNGHWQHSISGELLCVPSRAAVPRTDTIQPVEPS